MVLRIRYVLKIETPETRVCLIVVAQLFLVAQTVSFMSLCEPGLRVDEAAGIPELPAVLEVVGVITLL
jgi:hypothetical protein